MISKALSMFSKTLYIISKFISHDFKTFYKYTYLIHLPYDFKSIIYKVSKTLNTFLLNPMHSFQKYFLHSLTQPSNSASYVALAYLVPQPHELSTLCIDVSTPSARCRNTSRYTNSKIHVGSYYPHN